ncbi:MAG: ankyrin repeat domain-containing protein [Leptospiraceae bacterium]|nr:ankyrin repeat domain-containing protein [Leptospiraceae bacterium]
MKLFAKLIILLTLLSSSIYAGKKEDILEAVRDGDVEKLKTLVKGKIKMNFADSREMTPLMIAANDNNLEIANILIESGVDVNIKNKENGKTALMYAASNGFIEMCQLIIADKDIVLNAKDKSGKTALMHAVFNARKEVTKLFIDAGANVNSRTDTDESAMTFALKSGRSEIVNLLRAAGAKE